MIMLIKNLIRLLVIFPFLIGFNIAQAASLGSALGNKAQPEQAENPEQNQQQAIKNRQFIAPIKQLHNEQVQHQQMNMENARQLNREQHQQRRINNEQAVFYSPHCERGNTKKCQKARARWERKMRKQNQGYERRQQKHIINQMNTQRHTNERYIQSAPHNSETYQGRQNIDQPVTNNVQSTFNPNQPQGDQRQQQGDRMQMQNEESQSHQGTFRP